MHPEPGRAPLQQSDIAKRDAYDEDDFGCCHCSRYTTQAEAVTMTFGWVVKPGLFRCKGCPIVLDLDCRADILDDPDAGAALSGLGGGAGTGGATTEANGIGSAAAVGGAASLNGPKAAGQTVTGKKRRGQQHVGRSKAAANGAAAGRAAVAAAAEPPANARTSSTDGGRGTGVPVTKAKKAGSAVYSYGGSGAGGRSPAGRGSAAASSVLADDVGAAEAPPAGHDSAADAVGNDGAGADGENNAIDDLMNVTDQITGVLDGTLEAEEENEIMDQAMHAARTRVRRDIQPWVKDSYNWGIEEDDWAETPDKKPELTVGAGRIGLIDDIPEPNEPPERALNSITENVTPDPTRMRFYLHIFKTADTANARTLGPIEVVIALQLVTRNKIRNADIQYMFFILGLMINGCFHRLEYLQFASVAEFAAAMVTADSHLKRALVDDRGWPNLDYKALRRRFVFWKQRFFELDRDELATNTEGTAAGKLPLPQFLAELNAWREQGQITKSRAELIASIVTKRSGVTPIFSGAVLFLDFLTYLPLLCAAAEEDDKFMSDSEIAKAAARESDPAPRIEPDAMIDGQMVIDLEGNAANAQREAIAKRISEFGQETDEPGASEEVAPLLATVEQAPQRRRGNVSSRTRK